MDDVTVDDVTMDDVTSLGDVATIGQSCLAERHKYAEVNDLEHPLWLVVGLQSYAVTQRANLGSRRFHLCMFGGRRT